MKYRWTWLRKGILRLKRGGRSQDKEWEKRKGERGEGKTAQIQRLVTDDDTLKLGNTQLVFIQLP